LWIGVQEDQAFLDLQTRLENQLLENGFEASDREFNPHLTVGRFRNSANLTDLVKLGGRKHFGDYPIRELVLFESVLVNHVHKYNPIARRPI
jgi:2'-5' RNA ligase